MYFNCLRHITSDRNINFADSLQLIEREICELKQENSKNIEKLNDEYNLILGNGVNYIFNNFPKHLCEFEKILILFNLDDEEIKLIESYITLHNDLLKYMDTKNLNENIENISYEHMYSKMLEIKNLIINSNLEKTLKKHIEFN